MPVLRIKKGVRLEGLQPEAAIGLQVCASVFFHFGYDCVVTSGTEGDHAPGSLHHVGKAFDLRTRHLPANLVRTVGLEIRAALTRAWDVVIEADHLHCELQN